MLGGESKDRDSNEVICASRVEWEIDGHCGTVELKSLPFSHFPTRVDAVISHNPQLSVEHSFN